MVNTIAKAKDYIVKGKTYSVLHIAITVIIEA
jgi:hypothetical protein